MVITFLLNIENVEECFIIEFEKRLLILKPTVKQCLSPRQPQNLLVPPSTICQMSKLCCRIAIVTVSSTKHTLIYHIHILYHFHFHNFNKILHKIRHSDENKTRMWLVTIIQNNGIGDRF